jgi:hypothetical protein
MQVQKSESGYGQLDYVTQVCICGSQVFNIQVTFHDGEVSFIFGNMECAVCGTGYLIPTPEDSGV